MSIIVTVCSSCPAGRAGLADGLRQLVSAAGSDARVRKIDCMSGCTRPSTVSFRAPGKTVYLFGDLSEDDLPNLMIFLSMYAHSPDGNFADARPLGALREKAIARIPG